MTLCGSAGVLAFSGVAIAEATTATAIAATTLLIAFLGTAGVFPTGGYVPTL